ncbi:AMP-binding protein [Acidisphaera sp. L21]|uniref:AMP-binding protein n=1 Tax=Acidisphaera sp. L21 TaxID=1641851 RepID=UPI00131D5D4F|nr:AMP-binding protein [Acidisphaera sp. L21]
MTDADAFLAARDVLLTHRADIDAARAAFAWPVLERFNFALDHFDRMAAGNDATALRFIGRGDHDSSVSFAEMARRSNQVANHLRLLGVRRGDRVLLLLGNVPPLWEAMLACCKLGAVVIPATTMLTEDDLRDRFDRGRVRHAIVAGEHAARFEPFGEQYTRIAVGGAPGWQRFEDAYQASGDFVADGVTKATDPLLLYFTSGTTAKPKLVLHSHQSYPVGHLSTMYWIGLQPGDVHLNISSPGWAKHAWSSFFAPWIAGATIVILNQMRFDARGVLDALDRARVTTFCAPPTVWRMLIQEDLSTARVHLREALAAGEPLNPEVIEQVQRAWGLTIRDGYGQTETTLQIANTPGRTAQAGSMGWPLPGYEVALLDPDGHEATEGEIALSLRPRPLGLMDGYQAEDGSLRGVEGNWYRTGDTALRNDDGSLTYVGRADDVFKSSGYRISPFELESVLIEHPAVAEAAIVPSPDPTRTAMPKAFVLLAAGFQPDSATAASIFAHLRARLAPYKRVRRLEFAELPKTISGKIRRVELRRLEATRRQDGARGELEFLEDELGGA